MSNHLSPSAFNSWVSEKVHLFGGFMVGIGRGVNSRKALAGPHEIEKRLFARGLDGGINVVQAPVFSPSDSTVFAARGRQEWTNPARVHITRTLRGLAGLAGSADGRASIALSTSASFGVRQVLMNQRPVST
jgi:hypothetical protein